MTTPHPFTSGLFIDRPDVAQPTPVPLLGVTVEAELSCASAKVVLAQRYKNTEAKPIEAVYLFPLPIDAAICGFEAEVDGRRVEGRVEEREKAFEIYDDAMADGHGAFLMDQERPNVFTMSVGNLKPGSEATIRVSWVATVPWEGDALRFILPTTVSPRYTPAGSAPEVGQPDADKLDPERRFQVPYGLSFKLAVDGEVRRVTSPSHPISTTMSPVVVELAQTDVALDRDLVVIVEPAAIETPRAVSARDEAGTRYVQVAFRPDIDPAEGGAEVVFVVDCSGSMGGTSIASAKRALELCVRALDRQDRFDIVRFGSTFEALFGEARAYDDTTLKAAVEYVQRTNANLGGTEILSPLQAIAGRPLGEGRMRQVMLLTDGQVSNEAAVIELAKEHAATTRIFSFGIGAGVSEHLVREVARASRGEVEMIAPGERIEPKVLRQFGRVRSPALSDVKVDWGPLEVEQAPRTVPPVFRGELLTVWAKVRAGDSREATLTAGGKRWSVPLDLERATAGGPVPALWGRAAIRDLESDGGRHGSSQQRPGRDRRKNDKLIAIGKELGLVSSATSYVAVEVRAEGDRTTTQAELRRVPIALTHGWGGATPTRMLRRAAMAAPPPGMAQMMMTGAPKASGGMAASAARGAAGVFGRVAKALGGGSRRKRKSMRRDAARSEEVAASTIDFLSMEDAEADEPTDRLYDLLLTQRADGSFPMSAELRAQISDAPALAKLTEQHGESIVATALVLALFERDFSDRRAEWRAAADKATRFFGDAGPIDVSAAL